jgi:hypothetical protein
MAARLLEYPDDRPRRRPPARQAPRTFRAKVMASLTALVGAGSLMSFAAFGSFDNAHDPFPHSVLAPAGDATP